MFNVRRKTAQGIYLLILLLEVQVSLKYQNVLVWVMNQVKFQILTSLFDKKSINLVCVCQFIHRVHISGN